MSKIKVQLVRYDMSKTKNRKRKDMLVDGKSERFVRAQLEKIHKGEQVVNIHELVWDEEQIKEFLRRDERDTEEYFLGTIKFFDSGKGFGFIQPDVDMDDLFFHQSACKEGAPGDGERVEFKVSEGPKGLSAIGVRVIID
jgi:CspA family cold shock protein